MELKELLDELAAFGRHNDAEAAERSRKMLNITPETGEFLDLLVRATGAKSVLEIGTSNGYSTLWLARGVAAGGGRVTTLEHSEAKIAMARENFARAGMLAWITQLTGDAGAFLRTASTPFDLVFLDAERSAYVGWWPQLSALIAPGGLLVVDNATSHAAEMAPFMALVRADAVYVTSLAPIGNGEFLACKRA